MNGSSLVDFSAEATTGVDGEVIELLGLALADVGVEAMLADSAELVGRMLFDVAAEADDKLLGPAVTLAIPVPGRLVAVKTVVSSPCWIYII